MYGLFYETNLVSELFRTLMGESIIPLFMDKRFCRFDSCLSTGCPLKLNRKEETLWEKIARRNEGVGN